MKPAVEWVSRSEAAEAALALEAAGDVVAQGDDLVAWRPSTNSPGCRMNGSSPSGSTSAGQVGLLLRRVDVGVAVVVEDPEVAVEPDVDARRLDHAGRTARGRRGPTRSRLRGPGRRAARSILPGCAEVAADHQHQRQQRLAAADPGYSRWSCASSPREVTPVFVKAFRRWKATVRGETQHWAAISLLDMPWLTSCGDLALHRGELEQCRRVTLAGRLSGRAQLLGCSGDQRLGVQVLERLQRGAQVGARVDATLRAAQELAVREVGAGPVVRPAAGCWRGARAHSRRGLARRRVRPAGRGRGRRRPAPTATAVPSANGISSSTQTPACSRSPARTAASIRSRAASLQRVLSRMLPRWCSAARVSPSCAARVPFAQQVRSCTGSASTPSGCSAAVSRSARSAS